MPITRGRVLSLLVALAAAMSTVTGQTRPRARDLGVPFIGAPGPFNAITDVAGVTVGHTTLIEGNGALKVGSGPVRTGVTAILPRGADTIAHPSFAGWYSQNGNGEMTGTTWIEESGFLEGPIVITNTHSVGIARDAVIKWRVKAAAPDASGYWWSLPVVAETWDGDLNDINGFHVRPEHVAQALREAHGGAVAEGNVGGGTGMICHGFKCGTGTASRVVDVAGARYAVGALVQANYGVRESLRIAGVPVGQHLREERSGTDAAQGDTGSIIVVIATDAPLLPHQLKRLARRASLGLGRMGSYAGNGSGDLFLAFSTANAGAARDRPLNDARFIGNDHLDGLFEATVQATEEAIVNAMVAARDLCGEARHCARALPHDELVRLLKQYGRYTPPK
jgi:D-aminopeptidase